MGAGSRVDPAPLVSVAGLPVLERVEAETDAVAMATEALLRLPFEARSRSRQRARLTDGTEVALVLPRGTVLRHGMVVGGAGLRVRIEAADEDLLEVRCDGSLALARAAYHLGNRHVPVQVGDGWLRLQYDHVLEGMVRGLGGSITLVDDSFDPEGGAYAGGAHAHSHSHGSEHDHDHDHGHSHDASHRHEPEPARASVQHTDARHSPRIHDFLTDPLKR